jgi:xanthine/uracil permease
VKIPFTKYYIGSGLLSVMGTSFTFLPIAQAAISAQVNDPENPVDFPTAFGGLLGVFMIGSFVEMLMSFIPARYLRAIFPPWISGLTIFLIGASLIGSGVKVRSSNARVYVDILTVFNDTLTLCVLVSCHDRHGAAAPFAPPTLDSVAVSVSPTSPTATPFTWALDFSSCPSLWCWSFSAHPSCAAARLPSRF